MPSGKKHAIVVGGPECSVLCESCKCALIPPPPRWLPFLRSVHDQEVQSGCHMCVQLRYTYHSGREIREVRVPNQFRGHITLGTYQPPWKANSQGYFMYPCLRSSSVFEKRTRLCALYVIQSHGKVGHYVQVYPGC